MKIRYRRSRASALWMTHAKRTSRQNDGKPVPFRMANFLRSHFWGWLISYLRYRFGAKYPFQTYSAPKNNSEKPGVFNFSDDEEVRISMAGDWGTGTKEAALVAHFLRKFDPHYTIHIGDVYFAGDRHEVLENCLGISEHSQGVVWPHGSLGSFAMNGNHEMLARGIGYFKDFLPTLGVRGSDGKLAGQQASYFCLENKYWRVIALDTGYNCIGPFLLDLIKKPDCHQPKEVMDWLRNVVKLGDENDKRGIIILSHHQYYSAFEKKEYPKPAAQLASLWQKRNQSSAIPPVIWFWGHEHLFAIYDLFANGTELQAYGRCIGNGGAPEYISDVTVDEQKEKQRCKLLAYDKRFYETLDHSDLSFNGYSYLTFKKEQLLVEYRSIALKDEAPFLFPGEKPFLQSLDIENDTLLATETWTIDLNTGKLKHSGLENVIDDPGFRVLA